MSDTPIDVNKSYKHKFNFITIQKEILAKDRSTIVDKRYPHNLYFEEEVLLHKKDSFIEQFMTPEIINRVLTNDVVSRCLDNKILQKTDTLTSSFRNLSTSTQSYNKKLTEAHSDIQRKVMEMSELIVKSMKNINADVDDKLKELEVIKEEKINSMDVKLKAMQSNMEENISSIDEKLKKLESNTEEKIKSIKNNIDDIKNTINTNNEMRIIDLKKLTEEFSEQTNKIVENINWILGQFKKQL